MTRLMMSIEQAACMLLEVAREAGLEEFPGIAEDVLENNSHDEIVMIGQCLPPVLRELLPKRVLH
jgi:hypothetical protein